jgi:hypothetical protein
MTRTLSASIAALLSAPAFAHEGHGLFGTHWHASDAWGFLIVAVLAVAAWWASRGGQ